MRNGVILRITSDEGEEPQLRACLKGRAYRQRIYHPDRLKYPLQRVGRRGAGEFRRVSWDDALNAIAEQMIRIKNTYGADTILAATGPGNMTLLHNTAGGVLHRLLHMFGGGTGWRGSMSFGAAMAASRYTLGTTVTANDPEDLVNARLILLWAWNSAEAIWGSTTNWYITQAKERGARIIGVDPRYTETMAAWADQWIPIFPGTDTAMMMAMAYTMMVEALHDQDFLDTYTTGFEVFRDYVLGISDGSPKTPAWAEAITGVPRTTIEQVARDYAAMKPAALISGLGMQRTAYGEQSFRASITLASMTGNIGIPGGSAAGNYALQPRYRTAFGQFGAGPNALKKTIPVNKWADALLLGQSGGYESDIKMVYSLGRNLLNQVPTINKGVAALQKPEFMVVHEQFMTPTAKFADVLLPITTWFEREDVCLAPGYAIYMHKVIDPLYECKSDLEVFTELAKRLGIPGYNDKTEKEWLRSFVPASEIPDFEDFQKRGVFHFRREKPHIAFEEQIRYPSHNPFPTPSGKIEIYSQHLAELNQPQTIPAIPKYIEGWEGRSDPFRARYPLQLISPHANQYIHSTCTNIPWLQEIEPHALWINPKDARERGIENGDHVKVYNARGALVVPALVTERIMPGVVSLDQGAWYDPDVSGIDRGGSANILTRDEDTPLGDGATTHSCLVQVALAQE